MVDDLTRRGPEDRNKVNINQPWEVTYWSGKFGVSESKLLKAVQAVGPMVVAVEGWLAKN